MHVVDMSEVGAQRRRRIPLYVGPKKMIARADLAALEATGLWVFEEKHDGFWACAEVAGGRVVALTSRVGLPLDAPGLLGERIGEGDGLIVGELTADLVGAERSGTRRLRVFDVVSWSGIEMRQAPLTDRRRALEMVYAEALTERDRVTLVEQRETGAEAFYNEVIARRGEGLVVKRKDSKYRCAYADGKVDFWMRCKPLHTVDYVVMSHGQSRRTATQPGGSPNLQLGLYKDCARQGRKLVKVMDAPVPKEWDKRKLDEAVGKVVEVEGFEIWPSGAVRHGHVKRVREDKVAVDCSYEAALLA